MLMKLLYAFLFLFPVVALAQIDEEEQEAILAVRDSLYREDQFYIDLTFNLVREEAKSYEQNGFSGGYAIGFLRDMPINKRRNVAIAVGLGINANVLNHNLFIGGDNDNGDSVFELIPDDIDVSRNRLFTHYLEVPIEFRFRTSTVESYKFYRAHVGMKFKYLYHYKALFEGEGVKVIQRDIPEINRFQFGPMLTLGYNNFNFTAFYTLSTLFNEDAQIEGQPLNLQVFKVGLKFYVL